MFGFFGKKKLPNGAELAEEGLRQIAIAIKEGSITLERGRIFDDIHVHGDMPNGISRITYVMFSPSVQNQVIARCVILHDRTQNGMPIWQIDWAVLNQYRGKGVGTSVATKALTEFTSGMKGILKAGFFVEAVVEEGNEASKKIARELLGNEKVIINKVTGAHVHNFLKRFNG